MYFQCGVCLYWVQPGETHNCTLPPPHPPTLTFEPLPKPLYDSTAVPPLTFSTAA